MGFDFTLNFIQGSIRNGFDVGTGKKTVGFLFFEVAKMLGLEVCDVNYAKRMGSRLWQSPGFATRALKRVLLWNAAGHVSGKRMREYSDAETNDPEFQDVLKHLDTMRDAELQMVPEKLSSRDERDYSLAKEYQRKQ